MELSSVFLRMNPTITATTIPSAYMASISTAPSDKKPRTVCPAKNAPIISV